VNNPRWEASTYDRVSDPHARWGAAVAGRLHLRGDETILDAGCGSGRVTETLFELVPRGRVIALDASPEMLAQARLRLDRFGPRVSYVRADLLEPLPVEPVDAIFSTAALHWVRDHGRLFANLAAALRPGGRLVAQYGGAGNVARAIEIAERLEPRWRSPWVFDTPEQTRELLAAAGFTAIEAWLHDEPTPFADAASLATFLATVLFAPAREYLDDGGLRRFAEAVAAELPGRQLDYVRLNVVARRVTDA
jgi:trans-aconitate 2-methyltransferase